MNWESILQRQQGWTLENADELRLSIEEASEIYENAPLHELTMAADIRRKKLHPHQHFNHTLAQNISHQTDQKEKVDHKLNMLMSATDGVKL